MFFEGSRYENGGTDTLTTADGRVVRVKRVRFIADRPAQGALVVGQGDRLDRIAFRIYQDAELFWLICDANRALWPDDLVAEPGRVLRIPPSDG